MKDLLHARDDRDRAIRTARHTVHQLRTHHPDTDRELVDNLIQCAPAQIAAACERIEWKFSTTHTTSTEQP